MGELGELRNRVDQAVDRLSTAHEARQRQSHGLMTLLTDLEAKYEARSEELDHCKLRIEALTRENTDLAGLVDRLVRIADETVSSDDDDPLLRASTMAGELVADWSAPEGGSEHPTDASDEEHHEIAETDADPAEAIVASGDDEATDEPAAEDAVSDIEAFEAVAPEMRFENVSDEELAGERLDGDPEELAALLDTPIVPDAVSDPENETTMASEPLDIVSGDTDDADAIFETMEIDAAEIEAAETEAVTIDATEIEALALEAAAEPDPIAELDPVEELLAADLDIPEIVIEDDEPISRIDPDEDTESSIRAMMARLEDAAVRARAHAEEQSGSETEEAPAPAAAAGGS